MPLFSLRVLPALKLKVIISVSKKVSKSAVTRNTIRRRLRPIIKELPLKSAEYLFVVRPGAEKLRGEELKQEVERLVRL